MSTYKKFVAILKKPSVVLGSIIFLALFLRLFRLSFQDFWHDELYSIIVAQRNFGAGFDYMPPIYLFFLRIWLKIVPVTEFWVRLPNVFIGAGTIYLLYLFVKETFDRRTALWSCFFLAVSPTHIFYSQEAKYYPPALALAVLMQLFFIRVLRCASRKNLILYIVFSAVGLYTHQLLILLFPVQMIYLLTGAKGNSFFPKKFFIGQLSIAVLFLPVLIDGPRFLAGNPFAWLTVPNLKDLLYRSPLQMMGGDFWYLIPGLHRRICSVFRFLFFIGLISANRQILREKREVPKGLSFAVLWLLCPPVFLYIFSRLFFPLYHIRYFLISLLAFVTLLGWIIVNQKSRIIRIVCVVSYVFMCTLSLIYYYTHSVRPETRAAVNYLREHSSMTDRVLCSGFVNKCLLDYYFNRNGLSRSMDHMEHLHVVAWPPDTFRWFVQYFTDPPESIAPYLILRKELLFLKIYNIPSALERSLTGDPAQPNAVSSSAAK